MVTTQTADSVLKNYYLDAVAEQLNKAANPLLAAISHSVQDVSGKDVRKTVRYGVSGGVGAGTEEGTLPNPAGNRYAQFVSTLKNLYGTIEITDKAIRASRNNEGAFVSLLNSEMDGLIKSSAFNFGRMLYGDGSGRLAVISSSKGNVYTVDTVQNLAEGMVVDVFTSTDAPQASNVTVASVDRNKSTVTLANVSFTGAGQIIYLQKSKNLEITGLGAIFSDSGTLYGLPRENNAWMTPTKIDEVGEITEEVMMKAIDEAEERSGGKINFIVCSSGVRRALVKALSAYRTMDSVELEGGVKALSFNGIPVVADRFCPKGTMYLLNTNDFVLHELCDWQWLEGEDGKILKQVAGKPVYTATLVKYAELLCYCPGGQARLTGITEA